MKYRNSPPKPYGEGELLPFLQQFWIWADLMRKMLYSGQDFKKVT